MSDPQAQHPDYLDVLAPDYEILRELGRGGASVVYLARERELDREVAIKVIRDPHLSDGEAVARFQREARTLARLQHPNIVMLYAAKRLPGDSLALVMQQGPWRTLKSLIVERGPFPAAVTERVLHDIASALAYLHRNDIVHRDIKPENIFMDQETGRALLADFGLAKPGGSQGSVTLSGVVIGTPAYMSPEQIDGAEVDGQSDIYSLGMVGYELLTGRRPWEGENLYSIIYKQKHESLPPLSQVRPDVPEQLRVVVERAIEKERARRWPNAATLLAQLHRGDAPAEMPPALPVSVAAGADVGEMPTVELHEIARELAAASGPEPRWPSRSLLVVIPAVLLLLLAGGVAAFSLRARTPAAAAPFPSSSRPAVQAPSVHPPVELALRDSVDSTAALNPVAQAAAEPAGGAAAPVISAALPAESSATPATRGAATRETARAPQRAAAPTRQRTDAALPPAPDSSDIMRTLLERAPGGATLARTTRSETRRPSPRGQPVSLPAEAARANVVPPQLDNSDVVSRTLLRFYPRELSRAHVGGTVVLRVRVSTQGTVTGSLVLTSSGHPELDEAALKVASAMRFTPAVSAGVPVEIWANVPLVFQAPREEL